MTYESLDTPKINWPAGVNALLDGWHWGAHVSLVGSGDGYYLIRDEDDATVIAIQRPDMTEDDAPSEDDCLAVIRDARR